MPYNGLSALRRAGFKAIIYQKKSKLPSKLMTLRNTNASIAKMLLPAGIYFFFFGGLQDLQKLAN